MVCGGMRTRARRADCRTLWRPTLAPLATAGVSSEVREAQVSVGSELTTETSMTSALVGGEVKQVAV